MEPPQNRSGRLATAPKNTPIEFGITSGSSVQWMYEGSHDLCQGWGFTRSFGLIARRRRRQIYGGDDGEGIDRHHRTLRQYQGKAPAGCGSSPPRAPANMPILKYYGHHQEGAGILGGSFVPLRRHAAGKIPMPFEVVIMNNLYSRRRAGDAGRII